MIEQLTVIPKFVAACGLLRLCATYGLMHCGSQPKAVCKLLDHFVGEREQLVGYGKAERLGSLEVDDQLEFDWGLDRKLARVLALKNAIDIGRRASITINQVDPVGK